MKVKLTIEVVLKEEDYSFSEYVKNNELTSDNIDLIDDMVHEDLQNVLRQSVFKYSLQASDKTSNCILGDVSKSVCKYNKSCLWKRRFNYCSNKKVKCEHK